MSEELVLDTTDSQMPPPRKRQKKIVSARVAEPAPVSEETTEKKKGRPRKVRPPVPLAQAGTEQFIPIDTIDMGDESFRFRANLRVGDLMESIQREGQQIPIFLRKVDGRDTYQLISGFRRVTALLKLGVTHVKAIVRTDLDNDDKAFRVSILENEERKTYNDLDRANAIYQYKTRLAKTNAEIENIFRIGARQRQRLESITTFPDALKTAITDDRVSSTLAVRLMQHARQHVQKTGATWTTETVAWVKRWIAWITDNSATLEKLNSALREEVSEKREENPIEFCVPQTRDGKKSLRIRPISIDASLTAAQRKKLVEDLKTTIKFVEGLK